MKDLSILIPARNEIFLKRTVEDIVNNRTANTEVIAVLDGEWAEPPIPQYDNVNIIYLPESIGQRAAMNLACKLSKAKYIMKLDAHCAIAPGFDTTLLNDMQDDWTMVPIMRNLHAFNWVCESVLHLKREDKERIKHTRYQSPSGVCKECGKPTEMDVVWIAKTNPESTSYRFDTTMHFQYFTALKRRPEGKGDLTETMSLQGSCFMVTRDKYWELNLCDERWGSWGQQGVEVAVKTWLSGGKVICNHKTWYAHMFRTQGGDFGFPYPQSGRQIESARQRSRDIFFNNQYKKQIYPLSWLIDKFKPVPDWHDESGKEILERINSTSLEGK